MSWEMDHERAAERDREPDDAVEVLREVWSANGQTAADLEEAFGAQKSCKRMQDVGFEDMASGDNDMRAAWRATLERDGKLDESVGSIRDLVLGPPDSSR